MEDKLSKRKNIRLDNYDYGSCGAYFITICTIERRNFFWNNVGATTLCPQDIELSECGKIVDEAINNISIIYPSVTVIQYVIVPDHVHLLLMINADENGRPMVAPTIPRVMKQLKGYVTKRIGFSVWQKLYFDHVVRNRNDFEECAKYIHENPTRWQYRRSKK